MPNFTTTMRRSQLDNRIVAQTDEFSVPERLRFSTRAFGMHNAVWMLMLSALAARLAAIMLRGEFHAGAAAEYGSIAAGLLEGSGFAFNEAAIYTQHGVYEPSSAQPPVYPLLLAGIYWLLGVKTGAAHVVAMLFNAALGAATIPAAYAAAKRMGAQHGVALCAAALLTFWPTQVYAATQLNPVTLITFLTTLAVACFFRAIDLQSMASWVCFCLTAAWAVLTAPVLLPALIVALLIIMFSRRLPGSLRAAFIIVLLAASVSVIGPWTFRNWRVHGMFQPVTGTFWAGAWQGNNPYSAGTDRLVLTDEQAQRYWHQGIDRLRQYDLLTDAQRQALDGKRTAEREALWREWTFTYIRENPERYLQLCGIRLARTLWADWDDPRSRDPFYVYFASRSMLLLGLIVGLPLAIVQNWRVGWPLALGGAIIVTCTLTVTGARYALPLEPLQLALLALLLITLWQRITGNRVRPPIVRRFARGANDGASPASLGLQD